MEQRVNITQFTNNTESSGKRQLFSDGDIVHFVFCCILSLTIIIGNIFVITAFKLNKRLRTTTNLGLVSLAFGDFLVGLVSIPLWLYLHISFNDLDSRPAQYYSFFILFDMFNGSASIFQLTAISLERCFSIVSPIRHRSMPQSSHYRNVVIVWMLATTCSLSFLLSFSGLVSPKWYMTCIVFVCFVLPSGIIITSYYILFRTVRKRNLNSPTSNQSFNWASQRKTIITVLVVTALFIVAWSPFFIMTFVSLHFPKVLMQNVYMRRFPKWMQYLNSGINPLFYTYRSEDFRNTFKRMLFSVIRCQSFQEVCNER